MEAHYIESWIQEVAFHDQSWGTVAGQNSNHYPDLDFEDISTIRPFRNSMLWRILETNSQYLQQFIALPNQHLRHLSFVSFSNLCYVLISQAKVTFALLDSLDPGNHNTLDRDDDQLSVKQLVVNKVGYNKSCAALADKFRAVSRQSQSKEDYLEDAMQRYANHTISMALSYSNQLQSRSRSPAAQSATALGDVSTQQTVVTSLTRTDTWNGDVQPESSTAVTETVDWDSFNTISMDGVNGVNVFDEMVWETMMNEFLKPLGAQPGVG
jgi:hypothetical protein